MNQPSDRQQPQVIYQTQYNDEISLVDLALILIRQKKVIFVTFIACVLLSILAAILISPKLTFTTTLKVGGNPPVEAGSTTITKIKEAYIPMLENNTVGIEAKSPNGTNLIILESITAEPYADKVYTAHQTIANMVISSQNERLNQLTDQWDRNIHIYESSLNDLETNSYLAQLERQISEHRTRVESIDTSDMDNSFDVQKVRTKLGLLQDDYSKELALQRDHKLTLQTNIGELRNKLIELEKSSILNTAVVTMVSKTPTWLILSLGIILGIFGGIFMAFISEFIAKVKEAQNTATGHRDPQ